MRDGEKTLKRDDQNQDTGGPESRWASFVQRGGGQKVTVRIRRKCWVMIARPLKCKLLCLSYIILVGKESLKVLYKQGRKEKLGRL